MNIVRVSKHPYLPPFYAKVIWTSANHGIFEVSTFIDLYKIGHPAHPYFLKGETILAVKDWLGPIKIKLK